MIYFVNYLLLYIAFIAISNSVKVEMPSYHIRSHLRVGELFDQHITHVSQPTNFTLNPLVRSSPRYTAIYDNNRKIIMCTVPKVACTQWRKLMLLLARPERAQAFSNFYLGKNYTGKGKVPKWNAALNMSVNIPNVHNFDDVTVIYSLSDNLKEQYYNDRRFLKVIHVRNPLTRVLSAWLSKSKDNMDALDTHDFDNPYLWAAPFCKTFRQFVEEKLEKLLLKCTDISDIDEHLTPQHLFCDINRGITYDIYLKFEERAYWQPLLFEYLGLRNDRRFKINYLPKERLEVLPVIENVNSSSSIGKKGGKLKTQRQRSGGVFDFRPNSVAETGASNKAMIMRHYTRDLVDKVSRIYKVDIEMFHYHQEVQEIYEYFN